MAAGCLGSYWHVKRVPGRYSGVCKQRSAGRQIVVKAYSLAKSQNLYLGLDFGSSGARAICIDDGGNVIHDTRTEYHCTEISGWHHAWERALQDLLQQTPAHWRACIAAVAIAGTTTTSVLVDRHNGNVLADPILYNQPQSSSIATAAQVIVPDDHSAGAPVSSLCKLLFWHQHKVWQKARDDGAQPVLLHHADWLASLLHGRRTCSDWHNAARLGFDAAAGAYPPWLLKQEFAAVLPQDVFEPGCAVAPVLPDVSHKWGLSPSCTINAGTTDGGSNTGGAVLKQFFSADELHTLSKQINPILSSGLDYYPLLGQGQRFPISVPDMLPRMTPRPGNDAHFLHGLLEGIARIERESYDLLAQLGATPVSKVYTAGGGAANQIWSDMRQQMLGVPVIKSPADEAAYGAALLASQEKVNP